jgi:hypothetical protein
MRPGRLARVNTMTMTAEARFFQIGGKVVIMNGSDNLSYLDIATRQLHLLTRYLLRHPDLIR